MHAISTKVFRICAGVVIALSLPHTLAAQQSYTFTNASATGSAGPTQAMINTAYATTNLNGSVTILTQGIQQFTVPISGIYRITALGGQGYGSFGGRGASVAGNFSLTAGTVLRILVGQQGGPPLNSSNQYGGGGGSFVTYTNNAPLVVAGGGGGSWATSFQANSDGTVSLSGNAGLNGPAANGAGGTGGGGGATASSADAGAGITGNGGGTAGGLSFVNGGNGGSNRGQGGFGGGGGTSSWDNRRSGGGGGYSGGGGSSASSSTSGNPQGGGGGSFNGGSSQTNSSGVNLGHGRVIITEFCSINISAVGTNSLNRICSGNSVTLTTNAVSNYSWSTGATSSSIVVSPTLGTTYSLVATSSLACSASANFSVGVDAGIPVISIANTSSTTGGICPNASVALTASGASSYLWSGSVVNGVPFTPSVSSGYTVTAANTCGTGSAAVSVSVHIPPTVSAVASSPTLCSGNPVNITGVGNATSYTLSNGAGNGQNFFPNTTDNYTITGFSAQNCTNTAVVSITVVTTPVAPALANPPLICVGNSATLSSSGATNYTWSTGTSTFSSAQSVTVNPTSSTIYTLTKSNANCVDTRTVQLFVNQLPSVFAIVTPTLICASTPATLQAGGAQTYTWSAAGPPVFTVTGASPIVSPSITTLYTVAASDGTCANTTTVLLTTNPNPTLTITPSSTNICQGDAVNLTVGGASGYTWTTGAVLSNTAASSITENPIQSTNFQVTGINNFNCTSNAQLVVVVRTTPTLAIASTKSLVCIGAASGLTVSALAGPCTYTWDANASSANGAVAVVNPLTTSNYTVIGSASNGCTATANYQVAVFQPSFSVNSPTSSCLGGTINLIASGANTYTWNGNQPFAQISVSPLTATFYIVAATSSSNNVSCVSTNTVFVTIYNNPTVTAVPSRTQICRGEFTDINGGGAVTYTLNTGLSGSVIPVNPTNNTTYTLTGTDQNGCTSTATVQVKTSTCFGIEEYNALSHVSVYPNPNNGHFTLRSERDMKLQLTNQLGAVIKIITVTAETPSEIKVENLANGIYLLQDTERPGSLPIKIVISH